MRLFVILYTFALGFSVGFHNEVETQLEIDRTTAVYRHRPHKRLGHFREWLRFGPPPSENWLAPVRGIAHVRATYVNHCREHDVKPWLPKHAFLASQTWAPSPRGHLHRPWNCLRTWKLQAYLGSRPPMPTAVLAGFYGVAMDFALSLSMEAHLWVCSAILGRVGRSALSRLGALLGLRAKDVLFEVCAITKKLIALLGLGNPKSARFMGASTLIRNKVSPTSQLLLELRRRRSAFCWSTSLLASWHTPFSKRRPHRSGTKTSFTEMRRQPLRFSPM